MQFQDKFVLVHRHSHKPDGGTWGLPSGKVDPGESDLEALQRELFEETGYRADLREIELLGEFDFVSPRGDTVTFVTYRVTLTNPHDVVLEEAAHSEYKWVTVQEANARDDLIHDLHDLFKLLHLVK